jgi:SHS2 domain-containing protein
LGVELWSKKIYDLVMGNRIREKYHLIDHTADFGIHVSGTHSKDLFANAAQALFDVITDIDSLTGRDSCLVEVSGEDWSDLMVNWLREILYLWNGEERLVKSVNITALSANKLSAQVVFDPYDPDRHTVKTEIKAVTYHQIQVKRTHSGWTAKIIFDI